MDTAHALMDRAHASTRRPTGSVASRLRREADEVAERELAHRRAVLAALPPSDRDRVAALAHRVASELAECLAAEARRDERLREALRERP